MQNPLAACHREAIAERFLGKDTRCTRCGETRVHALERFSKPRVCTECRRQLEGTTNMDNHHIAGKANSNITISIRANDHRAYLSEDQKDWPTKTLQNSDGSPLLRGAACIRGLADLIVYLIAELLLWIAEMLEILDAYLIVQLGPMWWIHAEINKFAPRDEIDAE